MKKTSLVALSGIIAAVSIVIMLIAYFPYLTYALPALAGFMLIIPVFESGKRNAFAIYAAVSVLSFFICEKEAALSYILFFGYYPIIKATLEKIRVRSVEWIAKLAVFNVMFAAILLISTFVLGIDSESMGDFGKYSAVVLFCLGNAAFVLYDIALTKMISLYAFKYREKITKHIR